MGVKPLIHNFVGAKELYPKKYIWNTFSELKQIILSKEINPQEYHDFVKQNFSFKKQMQQIEEVLEG